MNYKVLCITDRSDLPETELFIGLKSAGVDIHVICNPTGKHYDRLKSSNVPVSNLVLDSRISLSGIHQLKKIFKHKKYDIIYCFNNKAASNALIAARGVRATFITYRGVAGNISFLSPASWMTHLHPRVKRIICVSNAVRSYFLSLNFLGLCLNPQKAVTIYKGHDVAWYHQKPTNLSEFGIPSKAFTVGFAGRNRPNKGLKYIIESVKWIPPEMPIHFVLMGKLENDIRLRKQISKSPRKNNFHLTGYRNDVPAITAACNSFIMPSVFKEGLSRAVIEAMASATPPIVTDIGGNPELVVDNESGRIIAPKNPKAIADAIMHLYNHPEKTIELGENARQRIRSQFNIAETITKTRMLFEEILEIGI